MMPNQILNLSVLKQKSLPEDLPPHELVSFKAAMSHLEKSKPEFWSSAVNFQTIADWLRGYLRDELRNGKKSYSNQTINNYICALQKVAAFVSETVQLTDVQTQARDRWLGIQKELELNLSTKAGLKHFKNAWPRFLNWMTERAISPDNFDMAIWREFREWLMKCFKRSKTAEGYSHQLKVALEKYGFDVNQKKVTRTFLDLIEKQILILGLHAVSERKFSISRDINETKLRTNQIKQKTFQNYEQTLRLYLDFHREKVERVGDLTEVLNRQDLEVYVEYIIQEKLYSEETFVNRMFQIATLMRYAWEVKIGSFNNVSPKDFLEINNNVKTLLDYKVHFKNSSVRERREKNPLPDYSYIYWKMMPAILNEIKSIRKERARIDRIPKSPLKDTYLRNLGFKYSDCMIGMAMLFMAPRPHDLFCEITATESKNPLTGEIQKPSVYKSSQGDWIIRYMASKTNRVDKIAYKNVARPYVYWVWPQSFSEYLEEYLSFYRPYIFPESPLLFPGRKDLMKVDRSDLHVGARDSTAITICAKISDKFSGQRRGENEFRSMLQTFMVVCDNELCEGFIVGHATNSTLSKVARTSYLNLSDEVIARKAKEYYRRFFEELARAEIRLRTTGALRGA